MTKRIIGIPGDKVSIQNGIVYINEQPVTESYLSPDVHTLPLNGRNYFEVPDSTTLSWAITGNTPTTPVHGMIHTFPLIALQERSFCVFSLHPVSYRGVTEIAIEPIHSGAPAYDPDNIVTGDRDGSRNRFPYARPEFGSDTSRGDDRTGRCDRTCHRRGNIRGNIRRSFWRDGGSRREQC